MYARPREASQGERKCVMKKNIEELFVRVGSITHFSESNQLLEADVNKISGGFHFTLNDSVTGAVLRSIFVGKLANKNEHRWAVLEKRGQQLRTIARKDTLQDALAVVNAILNKEGIWAFSMEALASLG